MLLRKLDQKYKNLIFFGVSVLLFVIMFFVALMVGKYHISVKTFFQMLSSPNGYNIERSIVVNLRLPRTIIAALTGIALSVSGLLYQETFQNKLVSPDLLGVSSGAGVGAAIAILIGLPTYIISGLAFIFGILTVCITLFIAKCFRNQSSLILVLSGIIVGGFMSALLSVIKYMADADTTLATIIFWLMGSFENAVMNDVYVFLPIVVICVSLVLVFSWRINIVALGREEAQSKGINYKAYRIVIICIATLLTACSVAFAGTISWVGLVVPHLARLLVGRNTRKSIPFSIVFGGLFMIIVDIFSRCFTAGELPLSAVTGLLGTVIFTIILFVRRNTINEND